MDITLAGEIHQHMTPRVDWFFGRGLSIGCGLHWSVSREWELLDRAHQIERIVAAIRAEMNGAEVDTSDIDAFLSFIATRTLKPWQHQFHTTNWDYLLQRQILKLGLTIQPSWCATTHVYHLNGTVEDLPDNEHRSPIVLETDGAQARTSSRESNAAYAKIIWNQTFVVVGMSFECEVDRFILQSLNRVEDDLPIGESTWILVNPNADSLHASSERIQTALPRARMISVVSSFSSWLKNEMPELQGLGAIAV